jgi:hypothetical protein
MEELVPTIQCNKEIEQILWFPVAELPGWRKKATTIEQERSFFGVSPFVPFLKSFISKMKAQKSGTRVVSKLPVTILKRPPSQPIDQPVLPKALSPQDEQVSENDDEADAVNEETFGDSNGSGWNFDDMINANKKLGFQTMYDDVTFDQQYGTSSATATACRHEAGGSTSLEEALLNAFLDGWNNSR